MGNTTSNSTSIKQDTQNNFLTVNNNTCSAFTSVDQSNNVVNATNVKGDVTLFTITGNVSASCAINQQVTQSATTILAAQAQQTSKTETDFFNDGVLYSGASNSANIQQSISNNMTSINSNTCNSQVLVSQDSNTVNLSGVGGNVTAFNISADANSICSIDNTVSQDAYNSQQASVDQEAVSMGMLVAIMSALVTLAIIGLVVIVVIFGLGGFGMVMFGGKKATASAPPPNPGYYGGYGPPQ